MNTLQRWVLSTVKPSEFSNLLLAKERKKKKKERGSQSHFTGHVTKIQIDLCRFIYFAVFHLKS